MEVIKKQVLQALTTGITLTCSGTCRIIIPDTGATYYFKICLTQEAEDVGFLSAFTTGFYGTTENAEESFGMGEELLVFNNEFFP